MVFLVKSLSQLKIQLKSKKFKKSQLKLNPCNTQIQNLCLFCQLVAIISKTSPKMVYEINVPVAIYFTSYELFFTHELQVIIYCVCYELVSTYELQVTAYCRSWECIVDCAKFFYYISYTFLRPIPYKIKYSQPAIPQQYISWMSALTLMMCETDDV